MSMISSHTDVFAHNHDIAGDIVSAKCECGFESTMKLGAGKSNFETVCKFPFYCKACSSLIVLNTLSENLVCPKCNSELIMPYDDYSLRLYKSDKSVFGWNTNDKTYKLTDDFYFCPQCLEFKLKFKSIGNFD
jgi:hypothetical protein